MTTTETRQHTIRVSASHQAVHVQTTDRGEGYATLANLTPEQAEALADSLRAAAAEQRKHAAQWVRDAAAATAEEIEQRLSTGLIGERNAADALRQLQSEARERYYAVVRGEDWSAGIERRRAERELMLRITSSPAYA